MIYYIWVIDMASRYQFRNEEIKEIEQARKNNKDKRAESRLKALAHAPFARSSNAFNLLSARLSFVSLRAAFIAAISSLLNL